jgi:glucose-1-phosphate cytidylyltransferase
MIKEYFLNYEAMNSDFTIVLGKQHTVQFHGDSHDEAGWRITFAETGEKAMTGARIARAARYLDDETDFAVTYGDGVADIDISAALQFHRAHGRLATITGVRPPSRFGELETEGDRVVAFTEKRQIGQGVVNGGFLLFRRGFLDYLRKDDECVLEREPFERCAADGQLQMYRHDGFWQCMDTVRDWEYLERQWVEGHAPWKVWA